MENYKEYALALEAKRNIIYWIEHNLSNYLKTNPENQEEIEHVIDYLVSDESPENIEKMSYLDAVKNTSKWTKKLIKKAEHIKEVATDTETVLDFKDGFRIVKLIGKNAYEREGYLMRHCVASYFGNSKEIYSLRDEQNMPHCTMEKDQQVKGKGNGNIHPKYVGYVVKFLEYIGMTVGDSEMSHLGYINVEKFKEYLKPETKYFNDKYVPEDEKLIDKEGDEFASLDLFDIKPLVKESFDGELKINFNLETFIKLSFDFLWKFAKKNNKGKSKQNDVASGDYSTAASSGYSSTAASSGYSSTAASSGNYSKAASLGHKSSAEAEGKESIACALGAEVKAKGKIGTWLVLSEWDKDWKKILNIKSVKVDGEKIKEDTWYILKNGKFEESN